MDRYIKVSEYINNYLTFKPQIRSKTKTINMMLGMLRKPHNYGHYTLSG